jgi:hypothetical protein
MACASTVAVVVPSPATSLVLLATSRTSCAPMFSKGSSSSISLAIVTPSLMTVGAELLLQNHIASARTEGHFHSVGDSIHTALQRVSCLLVIQNLFRRHRFHLLF